MTKKEAERKLDTSVRIAEVDAVRGLAVGLMVLYHAVFLSRMMVVLPLDPFAVGWLVVARLASTTFLLLVGVSLVLSFQRSSRHWWRRVAVRAGILYFWASIISLVTSLTIPEYPVYFGVLHLIALSMVLSIGVVNRPVRAVFAAVVSIFLGSFLREPIWQAGTALLPAQVARAVGILPPGTQTVDYWPLLPWVGVVFLGVALGNYLFLNGKPKYHNHWVFETKATKKLAIIGKHALLVYLVHVPLLFGILWCVQ